MFLRIYSYSLAFITTHLESGILYYHYIQGTKDAALSSTKEGLENALSIHWLERAQESLSYNHTCRAMQVCIGILFMWFLLRMAQTCICRAKIVVLLRRYVYLGVVGEGDDENLTEIKISPSDYPLAWAFKLICNILMIWFSCEISSFECFVTCHPSVKEFNSGHI